MLKLRGRLADSGAPLEAVHRSVARECVELLPSLHGAFRRSFRELILYGWIIAASLLLIAVCVYGSIDHLRDPSERQLAWILIAVAVALSAFLIWTARQVSIHYEFDRGSVRCISGKSRTLWREDLAGLSATTTFTGTAGITWMTLRWRDHSRRMEFFDSIRKALRLHPQGAPQYGAGHRTTPKTLDEAIAAEPVPGHIYLDVEAMCASIGGQSPEGLNKLALDLARRYLEGTVPYAVADAIANNIFGYCTKIIESLPGRTIPEPTFSIFLAFNAGEFHLDGIRDPTPDERFTRPQIAAILAKWSMSRAS